MNVRAVTGYIAHVLLAGYWLWVMSRTAPQLRKGARDRSLAATVALLKTAGIVITALLVGVIHFWATHIWHVLAALVVAVAVAIPLRRRYRALVAAPRHRLPTGLRAADGSYCPGRGSPPRPRQPIDSTEQTVGFTRDEVLRPGPAAYRGRDNPGQR
jgi:hypothetical protein